MYLQVRRVLNYEENVGSLLALYPTPATVIGAMNGEKPTWMLVAHIGIIGHDRVLVSLAASHFINGCIKETKKLSINLVDEAMLPEADYVGSVSGTKADKSAVFEYDLGDAGAPIIRRSPLTIECSVADIYNSPNFESFICTIDNTYDTILLGFPIWWGEAPRIMSTFIESHDSSGKTLAAFCTSGSSGFGSSDSALRSAASGAAWLDGHRFSAGASADDVMEWANELEIN